MKDTKYYLILKQTVGKEEDGKYYLFQDGSWEPDTNWVIMDRLMGFDPSEPPDSPYRIGCTDVLEQIEDISMEKAMMLTGGIK